jgi:hypothetical protein
MTTIRKLNFDIEQKKKQIKINKKMIELVSNQKSKQYLQNKISDLTGQLFLLEIKLKSIRKA